MEPANVAVVIRSAGERTAGACCELVSEQLPGARIEMVSKRPFEAALRQTYLLGIEIGALWTITVDADVLLRRGALVELAAMAEKLPPHFFHLEGRIHDKITGLFRQAGHRIYRTSLLQEAVCLVPRQGEEVRPEFSVLEKMAIRGHPSRRIGLIMGLHDHEQYYRDVYRKAFVHANKHPALIPHLVERAKAAVNEDLDFSLVLQGLWDGFQHKGPVYIDVEAYPRDLKPTLNCQVLEEKLPLPSNSIGFDDVSRWLAMAGAPPDFAWYDLGPDGKWLTGKRRTTAMGTPDSSGTSTEIRPTILYKLCMIGGSYLCQLGKSLKRLAKKRYPAVPSPSERRKVMDTRKA